MPWAVLAQALVVVVRRWRALSPKERARLGRLARDSQGRPGRLSRGERAELRALLGKLDLAGMGRDLVSLARGGKAGRRRRRR
jgi:hypothetical protein